MQPLIFYPGFQPRNDDWLKFALLYLDEIRPIVPELGDAQYSDTLREVRDNTDLIKVYRPSYLEGCNATLDAIDQIERILRAPERYGHLFQTAAVPDKWRDPDYDAVELWDEKYSAEWRHFCEDEQLARPSLHGLKMSSDLAAVYMTILANCIADVHGQSVISDDASIARFGRLVRQPVNKIDSSHLSMVEVSLPALLPQNLADVPLIKVLQLRNSADFADKRRAFQQVLGDVEDQIESGDTSASLVTELKTTWSDFSDAFLVLGVGVTNFSFDFWLVLNDGVVDAKGATKFLFDGAALAIGETIAVRDAWKNTKPRRLARQYVCDIQRLYEKALL